jgi:hypothetical protein
MAQGQSTTIISMIQWIRTSRLSTKNSLTGGENLDAHLHGLAHGELERRRRDHPLPLQLRRRLKQEGAGVRGLGRLKRVSPVGIGAIF